MFIFKGQRSAAYQTSKQNLICFQDSMTYFPCILLVLPYQYSSKYVYSMSSFLDLRLLSKAFRRRLLLLGYCSTSLAGSLSAYNRIEDDLRGSEGYW